MPAGSAAGADGWAGCGASCAGSGADGSGGTMDSCPALHSQPSLPGCCRSAAGGRPGLELAPPRAGEPSRTAFLG